MTPPLSPGEYGISTLRFTYVSLVEMGLYKGLFVIGREALMKLLVNTEMV